MYYIPLVLMIPFCIAEMVRRDKKNILFNLVFCVLLIMLCFRYGQGTDYFGYMYNYYMGDEHSEIGYRALGELFKFVGVKFEGFVFVVSLFQMGCIYRAIMLYSPYKAMSLLILYPTIYLTYLCSALRQGIVVGFFLGFMVKWLLEDSKKKYIVGCIVLSTIHSASLILLVLIFIKKYSQRFLYLCLIGAATVGCFVYVMPKSILAHINIGSFQYYIQETSVSFLGLLERIVLFIIITWVFKAVSKTSEKYEGISILYKVYFVGFIVSIATSPWGIVSSRLAMMMKAVEVLLIPMMIKENRKYRQLLLVFLIGYSLLMTTKNVSDYIDQGGYNGYNVINYPYLNVWDRDEAHRIRKQDDHLKSMLKKRVIN